MDDARGVEEGVTKLKFTQLDYSEEKLAAAVAAHGATLRELDLHFE